MQVISLVRPFFEVEHLVETPTLRQPLQAIHWVEEIRRPSGRRRWLLVYVEPLWMSLPLLLRQCTKALRDLLPLRLLQRRYDGGDVHPTREFHEDAVARLTEVSVGVHDVFQDNGDVTPGRHLLRSKGSKECLEEAHDERHLFLEEALRLPLRRFQTLNALQKLLDNAMTLTMSCQRHNHGRHKLLHLRLVNGLVFNESLHELQELRGLHVCFWALVQEHHEGCQSSVLALRQRLGHATGEVLSENRENIRICNFHPGLRFCVGRTSAVQVLTLETRLNRLGGEVCS
mmetsp:Transcript_5244/g.14858  ORF Transcript_5244/g.14858 Transcript_5244/m.14858 type:complete len:287 (+) Transcript_5244:4629-5489(+)